VWCRLPPRTICRPGPSLPPICRRRAVGRRERGEAFWFHQEGPAACARPGRRTPGTETGLQPGGSGQGDGQSHWPPGRIADGACPPSFRLLLRSADPQRSVWRSPDIPLPCSWHCWPGGFRRSGASRGPADRPSRRGPCQQGRWRAGGGPALARAGLVHGPWPALPCSSPCCVIQVTVADELGSWILSATSRPRVAAAFCTHRPPAARPTAVAKTAGVRRCSPRSRVLTGGADHLHGRTRLARRPP